MAQQSTVAATQPVEKTNFIITLLRGAGQVMFQGNAWTGLFFLIGIFWGSYATGNVLVAWGSVLGLVTSTVTGYILGLPHTDGKQGLWGFNGILVGCAFPTFLGSTLWMWLALIMCAAMTTWVRTGLNNVMAPWKVNSFTFTFVLSTWIFLLAARVMKGIPVELSVPALPIELFKTADGLHFVDLVVWWLKGVAQVFLVDNWVTGALFLIGLACSNWWSVLWAAFASAVSLFVILVLRGPATDIAEGLYGFSAVLTGIALGSIFYKPSWRSALWAFVGVIATVFVQAWLNLCLEPLGLPALTGPFCITTWLFLLPLLKFKSKEDIDHSKWDHRKFKIKNS
ncbi:MAG: urea transporter [Tidjanibacter sp.]|nr:urea transporter [Tidjanibacter sp.]